MWQTMFGQAVWKAFLTSLGGISTTVSAFDASCYMVIYQRLMTELLSPMAVMSEGLGFNLCVVPS